MFISQCECCGRHTIRKFNAETGELIWSNFHGSRINNPAYDAGEFEHAVFVDDPQDPEENPNRQVYGFGNVVEGEKLGIIQTYEDQGEESAPIRGSDESSIDDLLNSAPYPLRSQQQPYRGVIRANDSGWWGTASTPTIGNMAIRWDRDQAAVGMAMLPQPLGGISKNGQEATVDVVEDSYMSFASPHNAYRIAPDLSVLQSTGTANEATQSKNRLLAVEFDNIGGLFGVVVDEDEFSVNDEPGPLPPPPFGPPTGYRMRPFVDVVKMGGNFSIVGRLHLVPLPPLSGWIVEGITYPGGGHPVVPPSAFLLKIAELRATATGSIAYVRFGLVSYSTQSLYPPPDVDPTNVTAVDLNSMEVIGGWTVGLYITYFNTHGDGFLYIAENVSVDGGQQLKFQKRSGIDLVWESSIGSKGGGQVLSAISLSGGDVIVVGSFTDAAGEWAEIARLSGSDGSVIWYSKHSRQNRKPLYNVTASSDESLLYAVGQGAEPDEEDDEEEDH